MESKKLSKNELNMKLSELEEEYRFARSGLFVGGITSICAIVTVLFSFFAKIDVLEGNHIVMIVGIVAAAIIIYFSFVFRRTAKVRMEISKTKAALEMGSYEED